MKKSLVALAALAVIGAASAQSTVTIGGQLDAGIRSQKSSVSALGKTTTEAGGISGASRLWIIGSEDMGGGNKANFRLEMQPGMDTGATNASLFNRGAWLGLSGAWGETRLGRQGTTAIGLICTVDQSGCYSGFSGGGILFAGNGTQSRWISANVGRGQTAGGTMAQANAGDFTRVVNGVTYLTTNMSGFTGQVQYAFGGAANTQANGNGSVWGLNANYAQGPLFVGLTYQKAAADATVNATGKMTTLGATYDLGMAKLGGIYQSEAASGAVAYSSAKAWALTATFPVGAAAPYLKVGQHKTNGVGAFGNVNSADSQIFNLGTYYSLSKRTRLYADYAVDNKGSSGAVTAAPLNAGLNNTKPTIVSVGIQHNF